MNCVEAFSRQARRHPDKCALWLASGSSISFGGLRDLACMIQKELLAQGHVPGAPALLMLDLGPSLYASIIALLGLGSPVLLVEPWLSVDRIEGIITEVRPASFLSSTLGRLWGARIGAVRRIPLVFNPTAVAQGSKAAELRVDPVEPGCGGILTFTSGTTGGAPKAIRRTQGYLLEQLRVFERHFQPAAVDWCIFANFALANLGLGVTSVITGRDWSLGTLQKIASLPDTLQPRSLTCGPGFLEHVLGSGLHFRRLGAVHVGGAASDCALLERAFEQMPETHFTHVYGSTEAEPVALMDAREAVRLSRSLDRLQTLALGRPVEEIRIDNRPTGLRVSGPHVCAADQGWHDMGDRIEPGAGGVLWYAGRANQTSADFECEQLAYQELGHTRAFVHRDRQGRAWLLGEGVVGHERQLRSALPQLHGIEDLQIKRDARHRARIDRTTTVIKGAPWLVG